MDTDVGRSPASQGRAATPVEPSPAVSGKAGIPNAGFTPGPWDWWDDGTNLVRITEASEQRLIGRAVKPSDARLIAAAPELYEALAHIRELLVAYGPRYIAKATKLADAALAKSRGEVA